MQYKRVTQLRPAERRSDGDDARPNGFIRAGHEKPELVPKITSQPLKIVLFLYPNK